jgi:hypothetical protein
MSWSIATGGGSVEVLVFMRTIFVTGAAMIKPSLEPRAAYPPPLPSIPLPQRRRARHLRKIADYPKSPSYLRGFYDYYANAITEACGAKLRTLKLESEYEQAEAFLEDVFLNNCDPTRVDSEDIADDDSNSQP